MKLFVWNDIYPVSYGGSVGYAVGSDEEDARACLRLNAKIAYYGDTPKERHAAMALNIDRPADRVLEYPGAAEIYEWEE